MKEIKQLEEKRELVKAKLNELVHMVQWEH